MKRLIGLLLVVAMVFSSTAALALETTDYDITVAEKLIKQVRDGNGFRGNLTLELRNADDTLITSIPFLWNYIHVNEKGIIEEEERLGLALIEGETVLTTGEIQLNDQKLRFTADALEGNWYEMALSPMLVSGVNAEVGPVAAPMENAGAEAAQAYGIPSGMIRLLPDFLRSMGPVSKKVVSIMDRLVIKLDIWLEGYRQSAVIGELEDGTGTIAVNYVIGPSHVKAQVKQMIVDLLGDSEAMEELTKLFGKDVAAVYLNPAWQPYYLEAVDALPLEGDLTIDRTVSFTGETLNLSLSMPYRDPVMGDCILTYSRTMGEDEQPVNIIGLESQDRLVTLEYVEYSSMTDVSVIQGVFTSQPLEDAENPQPPMAIAFVLRSEETESTDEEGYVVQDVNYQLSFGPDEESKLENATVFDPTNVELKAKFFSKPPLKAATSVEASLSISGEDADTKIVLLFDGKTCARWTPADLPKEIVDFDQMSGEERAALGQTALTNLLPVFSPYIAPLMSGESSSIGIIGGADGPTSIYVSEGGETDAEMAEESVEESDDAEAAQESTEEP